MIDPNTGSFIHPEAKIGSDVKIGPFSYIDKNVVIGDGCKISPNVTILSGARIGKHCRIFPGAVISAIPQDLKFDGEETTAEIGDHTTIRECVTINRGTTYAHKTVVGKHCLLMAYSHVAHDCILGDHVILANDVNLAGHVQVDDWAILEGFVGVQQFLRIGTHCFIAATSFVRKSVPPFVKAAREPLSYVGVNHVGLRRRSFSDEQISRIQEVYRMIFVKSTNLTRSLEAVKKELPESKEREQILQFIEGCAETGILKGLS